ncbi:MAG: GH36 C-terminal domain-containing protein [Oscillospiraceae bacterium]
MEIKEIQGQIAFYKRYREVFQSGTFRRTELGWQVSDGKVTLAGVFHRLVYAAPGYERLRVKDLKPETDYRVTSLAQAIRVGQFGNLLKHVAPVNVNPNGALLRIADRHITLPGKPETLTASGAALAAGIMLSPLFRGTGYAPEQRTQGDFGSDVYLIEEIGGE